MSTYDALIKEIKQKKFHPVYFIHGQESFFMDKVIEALEAHVLNEMEKAFNYTLVYGKDVQPGPLMDTCLRLPMMAERQLVIVRESQYMDKIELLEPYLKKPNPQTVLVFHFKKDKTDKSVLKLFKDAVIFESAGAKEREIPGWVQNYLSQYDSKITEKAIMMLIEFLGNDLGKIANELDKLIINKGRNATITEDDIERNIGVSKDYNVFEFQKAIAGKQFFKVFQMIDYFAQNSKAAPIPMVTAVLYKFYAELYQIKSGMSLPQPELAKRMGLSEKQVWLLKDNLNFAKLYSIQQIENCLETVHEFDMKGKGLGAGNTAYDQLMKEMAYKLMR